ncbi:MAG: Gfo/Idh/MocA family oxidoreductase [Sedimentisphaerales bacterium]|nr:Gfo/Idh/MocA family oxidoreductase [Sedimentisphaerales bacterium]
MSNMYRWGIVGAGRVAHKFAEAMNHVKDAKLQAVASTNSKRAGDFAKKHSIPDHFDNYGQLYSSGKVDIVYVATTHNFHCSSTIDALNARKHVLCEKPMAVNASQVRQMINTARTNDLFLMEAMWTRFLPIMHEVRNIIKKGTIGLPQFLYADFGIRFNYDPQSRLYNPALAGGALLDLGVYCLALASMLFGRPNNISSTIKMTDTDVDARSTVIFEYDNAKVAVLLQALDMETPKEALIVGTEGSIKLHPIWMWGTDYTLKLNNGTEKTYKVDTNENGFVYQIMAVHKAINEGKTQCELMSLDETLAIAETMDALRSQWNFKYPFE